MNQKIETENFADAAGLPLYADYAGQESKAFLCLDTSSPYLYTKERAPSESGLSPDEWRGIIRLYSIPNNLTGAGLTKLLASERVQALAATIAAGTEIGWSGTNDTAALSDAAIEADSALEEFCAAISDSGAFDSLEPWCAEAWLENAALRDVLGEGESIDQAARRIEREARCAGVFLTPGNIAKAIEEKQDRARDLL